MPRLRGGKVLRRLRDDPPTANLKIIMVSGQASGEGMAELMLAGADDFLTKPFSIVELLARVKSALRIKDSQNRSDSLNHSLLSLNQQLEKNLNLRDSDLVGARKTLTLGLAELVIHRGAYSSSHLHRIQKYVRHLVQEASNSPALAGALNPDFIQILESTAPLHDVGMIGLPDYLYLKPDKLSDEERVLMRQHTVIGANILKKMAQAHGFAFDFLQMAIDISRHHHKRWDGKGYPDRLSAQEIPLAARIVSIADVYDSLRSRRPHNPPLSHVAAVEVMAESSHGQFDPTLLESFRLCAPRLRADVQGTSGLNDVYSASRKRKRRAGITIRRLRFRLVKCGRVSEPRP
ncbi:MAG: HD domain-containing protein [Gemmataceae bacterium]|nr:HD domain-containing protein [Gemmataceae bacterium]